MPINIKAFKEVEVRSSLASIKIDKAKSSRDEVVLKSFGAGKTPNGEVLRRNEAWYSKVYAFFKDPSGSANKSLRQEFVKAFQREFNQDISGIVNPKSREPLNAKLVQQLITQAENKKPTPNVTFGASRPVQHSTNVTAEKVENAVNQFMENKKGVASNGIAALNILGDLEGFHQIQASLKPTKSQEKDYLEDEYEKSMTVRKNFSGSLAPFSDLAHLSGDISHYGRLSANDNKMVLLTIQNFRDFLPPGLMEKSGVKTDVLDNISVKFMQLNHLVKEYDSGLCNNNTLQQLGYQILTITGDIYKQLDEVLNFLVDKETRKTVESFGDTEAGKEMYPGDNSTERREKTVNKYDRVVQSLLQTRNAVSNPEGGFQGLVAFGLLLSGAPERGYEFQK